MVINPIVGVYIPIIRIPIKGGMIIPNIATFDHGTYADQSILWILGRYYGRAQAPWCERINSTKGWPNSWPFPARKKKQTTGASHGLCMEDQTTGFSGEKEQTPKNMTKKWRSMMNC